MPTTVRSQPGSTSALREANARRILSVLRTEQRLRRGLSQAQIARRTGLAPATVSGIVRSLSAAGVLDVERGAGRRGALVRFGAGGGMVAGVNFGHTHVAVAVADLSGTLLASRRAALAPDHAATDGLALAGRLLDEALNSCGSDRSRLRRGGLGLPAPLFHGVVQSPGILPGWTGLDPAEIASASFGVPFHADNDANLAALAEYRRGPEISSDSLVFIKISSGLGAGVLLDGELRRGVSGMAGELGHVTLDENGPFCRCGNRGCLEAYVSVQHVQESLAATLPEATFAEVITQAEQGHSGAIRALEDVGHHLGQSFAVVVNMLDPGTIVLGGEMALAGDFVLRPLRTALRRHCLAPVAQETQVLVASLGDDASVVGAIETALDHLDLIEGLAS